MRQEPGNGPGDCAGMAQDAAFAAPQTLPVTKQTGLYGTLIKPKDPGEGLDIRFLLLMSPPHPFT